MPWAPDKLQTPIFLKTGDEFAWPENERVFYMLTRDGLFLCRNHQFFRSSARVDRWPAELAAHEPQLKLNYPLIPRRLLEQVVGFFSIIGRRHCSEAAVLLAWNQATTKLEVIVPEQVGIVSQGWYSHLYPMELHYETPPLPPHLMVIGDIHSHVDMAAYASGMDKADEEFRPGLHIVVGRIQDEPPQFHCEVTVDGARFRVRDLETVIAGYKRRRESEVPDDWLAKVTIKTWSSAKGTYTYLPPAADIPEAVEIGETACAPSRHVAGSADGAAENSFSRTDECESAATKGPAALRSLPTPQSHLNSGSSPPTDPPPPIP